MGTTIGALAEEDRARAGAAEYKGHSFMDLARFDVSTHHMIIFDVLSIEAKVGEKGDRMRLFLSDKGYANAREDASKGHIKILGHAHVKRGELHYDAPEQVR